MFYICLSALYRPLYPQTRQLPSGGRFSICARFRRCKKRHREGRPWRQKMNILYKCMCFMRIARRRNRGKFSETHMVPVNTIRSEFSLFQGNLASGAKSRNTRYDIHFYANFIFARRRLFFINTKEYIRD